MSTSKVLDSNYFLIGYTNYSDDGYHKDTEQKLGGYSSRAQYCWESVTKIDYSSITLRATIEEVTIDVNITDYLSANSPVDLEVREQDKGSWIESAGNIPRRTNPTFFDESTKFPDPLSVVSIPVQGVGVFTIPSTPELVQLIQDQLDGTKDPNNGIMITYYPDYYNYYITINQIQFTIKYTESSTGRRRIMVIS
jgi:hypothetical protein